MATRKSKFSSINVSQLRADLIAVGLVYEVAKMHGCSRGAMARLIATHKLQDALDQGTEARFERARETKRPAREAALRDAEALANQSEAQIGLFNKKLLGAWSMPMTEMKKVEGKRDDAYNTHLEKAREARQLKARFRKIYGGAT